MAEILRTFIMAQTSHKILQRLRLLIATICLTISLATVFSFLFSVDSLVPIHTSNTCGGKCIANQGLRDTVYSFLSEIPTETDVTNSILKTRGKVDMPHVSNDEIPVSQTLLVSNGHRRGLLQIKASDNEVESAVNVISSDTVRIKVPDGVEVMTRYDPELDKTPDCPAESIIVPNIIHWTWFYSAPREFRFHHFISALSVIRIQRPAQIYLWYDTLPTGQYWRNITRESRDSNIQIVYNKVTPPTKVFNISIIAPEHKSDVHRLRIMYDYGGIYMDLDVVIVKSFNPLRCYELTLGQETSDKLNNGIIIAARKARLLSIWFDRYRTFDPYVWDSHNVYMPFQLSQEYPDLIHIEHTTMHRPNWVEFEDVKYIYRRTLRYDWSRNYCVHLWYRYHKVEYDQSSIRTLDTTLGDLFRFIYFGSPDIR